MGNRAIYQIHENEKKQIFTAHNGANALSPLLWLFQAKKIQSIIEEPQSVSNIMAHLGSDGNYYNPRLQDADMLLVPVELRQYRSLQDSYNNHNLYEMHIILDLDQNVCNLSYNHNCSWFQTMDNLSIPLTAGLNNVAKLLEHGEKNGIKDFYELLSIYNRSTGIEILLESSRRNMKLEDFINSQEAQELKKQYLQIYGNPEEVDSEEMEER